MPWFGKVKLGQNACTKMVKEMAEAAGLSSKKSNHSLRVTTTTTLFSKGYLKSSCKSVLATDLSLLSGCMNVQMRNKKNYLLANKMKLNYHEEMEEMSYENDCPPKKQRTRAEGAMYVQNCVLNVYGASNLIQGVKPLQQNLEAYESSCNSPIYDASFQHVIPFLEQIANLIPQTFNSFNSILRHLSFWPMWSIGVLRTFWCFCYSLIIHRGSNSPDLAGDLPDSPYFWDILPLSCFW